MNTNYKVIWIASYPKSGNTWVRFLLANLLCGPQSNSKEMEKIVCDIHKPLNTPNDIYKFGETVFFKTHWTFQKIASLNVETKGAVYIYRNPLDVISSHVNYFKLNHNDSMKNAFIEQFLNSCGAPQWLGFGMGTWIENIEGWVFYHKNFPCLILKYEELKFNTFDVVKKLCHFLSINKNDLEITRSIEQSSFENLRSMEERELAAKVTGFFHFVHQDNKEPFYRFMNKGKVGTYKDILSKEQIGRCVEKFGPTMQKLGYNIEDIF
jgi:hypothetical protein